MADTEQVETEVDDASDLWREAADALEGKKPTAKESVQAKEEVSKKEIEPATEPEEQAEEDEPEPEEGEAEVEEPTEEPADPYEGVPAALKAEIESLKVQAEKAEKYEHEARSHRGRVAHLQKKVDELSQKLASQESGPANDKETEAADPVASIFDTPDWKKFEEDFGADVAGPQKAAMRRLFEAMHSRIQQIENQARSLQDNANLTHQQREAVKLEGMYREWAEDSSEPGSDPAWLQYVAQNYDDFFEFSQSSKHRQAIWERNKDNVVDADEVFDLITAFEANRSRKSRKSESVSASKEDKPKPNGSGDKPKPQPRELTPKQKVQLKSAATIAPRSAPGSVGRSDDLPDPDTFAFDYFADKAQAR
jgi:hypothetical protein